MHRKTLFLVALVVIVLAIMSTGLAVAGHAVSPVTALAVTGTGDTLADDGVSTLREAVIAANTNTPSGAASGECPAGEDGAPAAWMKGSRLGIVLTPDLPRLEILAILTRLFDGTR